MIALDPGSTALVLVDLQDGVIPMGKAPRSGEAVAAAAKKVAAAFRDAGAPVVLVHVDFARGVQPSQLVDRPGIPPEGTPPGYTTIVDGLQHDGDVVVLKHHWGAFVGTDLDVHLRRRGVRTVVIGGLVTNFGVESTARSAWEYSYDVVIAEDLTAGLSVEEHEFSIRTVLPNITRIVRSGDISFDAG